MTTRFQDYVHPEDYKQLEDLIRKIVVERLDAKMEFVINNRLQEWFNTNIKRLVEEELKNQFKKMMIVKFGEE